MTILCIGDSNTYGYDPQSPLGSRYPPEIRWTERLPGQQTINAGVNGMRLPRDPGPVLRRIRAAAPGLITVMLGTNDLLEGLSAGETAARMEAFLIALMEARTPLLLVAPPPLQWGEWVRSRTLMGESERLGSLYARLARSLGIAFADANDWGVELSFDGVHFSPRGHAAFALGLTELLNDTRIW